MKNKKIQIIAIDSDDAFFPVRQHLIYKTGILDDRSTLTKRKFGYVSADITLDECIPEIQEVKGYVFYAVKFKYI